MGTETGSWLSSCLSSVFEVMILGGMGSVEEQEEISLTRRETTNRYFLRINLH